MANADGSHRRRLPERSCRPAVVRRRRDLWRWGRSPDGRSWPDRR